LVEDLLQDRTLSYREIARRAACSDFSVRSIARELNASNGVDKTPIEPLTLREWGILAAVVAVIFGGIWLLSRQLPPLDGTM